MKKYLKQLFWGLVVSTTILISFKVNGQSIIGKWKVLGYETHKEKGIIEIYKDGDQYLGKVISISGPYGNPVCTACEGQKKDREIIGMEVIWGLRKEGDRYTNGTILDVENGNEYRCTLWVEKGKLMVRGFYMCLYSTQEWPRADDTAILINGGNQPFP